MYQVLPPAFLHEFKGHAIIARKGGEPGNEAKPGLRLVIRQWRSQSMKCGVRRAFSKRSTCLMAKVVDSSVTVAKRMPIMRLRDLRCVC